MRVYKFRVIKKSIIAMSKTGSLTGLPNDYYIN